MIAFSLDHCEYGVLTRLCSDFNAKQDAEMLANSEQARLVKKIQLDENTATVKISSVKRPKHSRVNSCCERLLTL